MAEAPFVFAFDVNPERDRGAIGVAGYAGDDVVLEVVDDRRGTWWMVDRICELNERHRPAAWLVEGRSPAASLIPELVKRGLVVASERGRGVPAGAVVVVGSEMARACGDLFDRVTQGGLKHLDQPEITTALAGAAKRPIGDAWGWARKELVNIAPLVAITLAAYGLSTVAAPDPRVFVFR
jgi:hypothetical protein